MRVIAKRALREFWERFPDAEDALKTWFAEAERAFWSNPGEIKSQYRSASILKDNRVVFNICGSKYRLVVKISYKNGIVLVRFVGTHREYDAGNAEEV
jgi:mRNA interferase HigB